VSSIISRDHLTPRCNVLDTEPYILTALLQTLSFCKVFDGGVGEKGDGGVDGGVGEEGDGG
jgi:hypothetical protein